MSKKVAKELRPTQFRSVEWLRTYVENDRARIAYFEKLLPPPNPARILGIDPGTTNLALIYWEIGQTPLSLKIEDVMKPSKITFETDNGHLRYIESILQFFLASRSIDLIIKEGVAHYKPFGVALAGRCQHVIERLALEYRVPFYTVNPSTMRRYLGTDEKSTTKLEVYKRWGYEFASEDETDTFALIQTGLAILRGEIAATVKEEKKRKKAAA
jgi:hypothetical protein